MKATGVKSSSIDADAARRPELLWSPTRTELLTTKFMRNRVLFSTLAHDVLDPLRKKKGSPLRLLFWACSTGCEPYTLKFLLGPDSKDEIVGIDQDPDAIRQARLGVYSSASWTAFLDDQRPLLTQAEITQLFEPANDGSEQSFRVREPYRKNVSFLTGDLFSTEPAVPLNSFDLVVCNNLLLHLKPGSASSAWDCLYKYLNDDGVLVIGGCNPSVRAASAKRLNLVPCTEKLTEISKSWCGVSGAWHFTPRPAWAFQEPQETDPDYSFLAGEIFRKSNMEKRPWGAQSPGARVKNIVISGTNFWNPGDDFVRDGVIQILRKVFDDARLNFLFYNFNPDFYPHENLFASSNIISSGDLEKFRDSVDAVVVVGVSAGHELKPLYRWVLANGLAEKVYLISGHYESGYCKEHISEEPEASIFRKARLIIGRTKKYPDFIRSAGISYHHLNCPALLSVPEVKAIVPGKKIERIGFSIQLPPMLGGLINQSCVQGSYELALTVLRGLARSYQVEVVAHHKTEYFHFLNLLQGTGIPVIFSSFYQDLLAAYRRYDLVVTTRLHASLLANGHGIPGIIINDTDRHSHTLEGFPHSPLVNTPDSFAASFARWRQADLGEVAREADQFKTDLLERYVQILQPLMMQGKRPVPIPNGPISNAEATTTMPDPKSISRSLEGVERILFVRTDSIGDAVLASSMLEPIRKKFPQAKIAVLCQQHVAELLTACPLVDSIICYDRKKMDVTAEHDQIISEISAFQPEVILNSVRSRDKFSDELTLAFPEARHIAIEGDLNNISESERDNAGQKYDVLIPTSNLAKPELERHADFLRGLGIEAPLLQPVVWTSEDDEILADAFFKERKLNSTRTIAVFPGAQWDIRVYPYYADALRALDGFQFLVFGTAAQSRLAETLETQLPGLTLNLCGRTTLRETSALLRRCCLYVGAESAGAHVACAVGVPNVVLLGGGHFGRFMPYSPLTSAVSLPLHCFGCNWRCQYSHAHCIKDVSPKVLSAAIHHTLQSRSSRPRVFVQASDSWPSGTTLPSWERPDPWLDKAGVEIIEIPLAAGTSIQTPEITLSTQCTVSQTALPIHKIEARLESSPAENVEIVGQGIPDPLVTVVVSTYQSQKFIGACLENLSRQTIFQRCEVIVVDSGSPENERAIVAKFQERFPNIRYVRTARETLYGAWNRGLELARGRYWANLNTDDSLRDDALEILVAALDKHANCALAYADNAWTTKPNDTFPSTHIVRTVRYPDYAPLETLFYCITGCLQFFRTESLRRLGGFDASLRCAGDYEATLKLMVARMNAVHVPEILSLFYQNTSGLTQATNRAALEHDQVMNRYRANLEIGNIFQVEAGEASSGANALARLGVHAVKFSVPWEDQPMAHHDFALASFEKALELDPANAAAGVNLVLLYQKLNRLNIVEGELVRRWPRMNAWLQQFRTGQAVALPHVKHAVVGPVYRPGEWSHRPSLKQLAGEPKALHPWITRIDGRHVYLSQELFPQPAGLSYQAEELRSAAKRLAALMAELPPFYAHFGGAGDALLLMASFYDQKPEAVVFSFPNSVGAAKALFEAFPKVSKIYFLPQHTEPFFHIILRYAVYQLKNCFGAGTTPRDGYDDEWKATLDIEKKYRINKAPRWAAAFRQNENSRKVAVAPKGSLNGMIGSKRNIILPELWPQIISHIVERGFEPVILGLPAEAKEYAALPGCVDARGESFAGQMKLVGQCAGVVGADSWAKTFSALAQIPTVVFEPLKGADLCAWKDASDWVFIEPWPAIKMVKSLEEFRSAFDSRIARITREIARPKPVIAWEGSFLDHGSLSHVNRELTARLSGKLELARIGRNGAAAAAKSDPALQACAQHLQAKAPAQTAVTVRHQWPPNWSRPERGALVVIQPWEYGALPKAWVEASPNVDEFWVPSPLVRAMYLDSGIAPEKVRVVHNGVDSRKFRPGLTPMTLKTKKKFKFLFVGGTIFRKGPDVLLAAYTEAFNASDDVCLVIKDFGGDSFYQGQTAEAAIRELQQKPNAPEILYLKDELTAGQMPALYAACDALVLPYRGEGFGMPVLEAMACGLPVIVTAAGATDSFVSAEAGWKIASRSLLLQDRVGDIPLVKAGWLREPNRAQLTSILKFAASHPEECRRRGACGRQIVERRFDWDEIAALVAHRLKELAERALPELPTAAAETTTFTTTSAPVSPARPGVLLVGKLDEARQSFARKDLACAWQQACHAISLRPVHPDAWLLLAEIAVAIGDAQTARACTQMARDLAPGLKPAKSALAKPARAASKPGWLVLPEQVQQTPRDKTHSRLTVCVIAKNEEKFLAKALKSVKPIAHQIVVVDTGSTDRTVEIARSMGAEVHQFEWCDDFSAARNAALEHARGDWVLILDADEELPPDQHARLLADLKNPTRIALRLPLVNQGQEAEGHSYVPRLFRNAPGVCFTGRIHEQVFPSLIAVGKAWGLGTGLGTAQLLHHGYSKENLKDRNKIERNLKLLRQAVEENPDDPNLAMNLGLELVRSEDLPAGLPHYRRAFELIAAQPAGKTAPELLEALLTQFTSHLYKVRAHTEVVELLTSATAKQAGLTASLHFALGLSYFELRQFRDAAEQMRQCLAKRKQTALTPINTDILTAAPYHCLGLSLAKCGDNAGAEKAFQAGMNEPAKGDELKLDYAKFLVELGRPVEALHKLHELVAQNPRSAAGWRLGAKLALSHREFLEVACDWTAEALKQLPENAELIGQRAEALLLSQQADKAAEFWRILWKREQQTRALAALLICEIVEGHPLPDAGVFEAEIGPVSRAFIDWYRRCLEMRAKSVVTRINQRLDVLRSVLPAAAAMIESAVGEASQEAPVEPEPCLA